MPRNARIVWPGLPYHVTQRGTNGQTVFYSVADRKTYLDLLRANLEDCNVRILAFCLMSNHVHWIIVPGMEDSLARLFRRVHGRYAQYLNARRQRNGHLWQNRFYSCPLGETHLWTALRYVELNPVRAGLVEAPQRYRWSSAASHWGGMDPFGIVDMAYWQSQGGVERWHPLLMASEDYVSLRLLRACTYAGRPLGDENFLMQFEERFQRRWKRPANQLPAVHQSAAGVTISNAI